MGPRRSAATASCWSSNSDRWVVGRYKALLIGVGAYETRGVQPLPFVGDDLDRLASALRGSGFDAVEVCTRGTHGKPISANFVKGQVGGFVRHARKGDTLVIALSGHGVHHRGRSYLVPEDIHEDTHPLASGCVAIDWAAELENSLAEHVVFLIDACREGIEQDSMGQTGVREWSEDKVDASLRRKVAKVYGCTKGQYALFVRPCDTPADPLPGIESGASFSLFSRAVADVISAQPATAALDLATFEDAVQDRVDLLHRAYRKSGQPQTVRIDTDIKKHEFLFLPSPHLPAPRPSRTASSAAPGRTNRYEEAVMGVGAPALVVTPQGGQEPSAPNGRRAPSGDVTAGRKERQKEFERRKKELQKESGRLDRQWKRITRGRIAWGRVALLVGATSLLIGGLGYGIWASYEPSGSRTDRTAGKSSTASASPSVPAGGLRTAPTPPPGTTPDLGGQAVNTAAVKDLPRCTAAGPTGPVTAQLRAQHNSYRGNEDPVLVLTVTSTSACRINATPQSVRLTLTSTENHPMWDSSPCAAWVPDRWIAVSPSAPATLTYRWNRHRLASCRETAKAPAGTYLATGTLTALSSLRTQTSFVLDAG
ncbi:caspase domain-containing protein [Streptomyces sp. NPDC048595]|uniref:caspase family protein n=1 Tax=Streptomyces sp. NPDC048595 TaxID=3365576 RepID=UPI00371963F0